MRAIIFAGPSLPQSARPLDALIDWRPPARHGDLYLAALEGPASIGLIDGYFDAVPSVWHKEILWAMAKGIRVYGAASIGALRAAELADFGMIGVGWVFNMFRDGTLTDDDEVALLHGPAKLGYVPVTEAMVNIRATLAAAAQAGVISLTCAAALTTVAKTRFYQERNYDSLFTDDNCRAVGLATSGRRLLIDWLVKGRVDVKRSDAMALLDMVRNCASPPLPPPANFSLTETAAWLSAVRRLAGRAVARD
jgi:hypothetical protein